MHLEGSNCDSELITKSKLKNKKCISNKIELSNNENNSDYDNLLLNQNEADNLQSDSEIWNNLFYRSTDINSELADNNKNDDYNNDLNEFVDSEESDNSEAKSLTEFELLNANKPTIKQLFEKCEDTDIVIPILATQYPLCTKYTQKGSKIPTHGKSLKFTVYIHKKK
ncbi:5953_t:CDS:2, partial [Racocetra fulgida]